MTELFIFNIDEDGVTCERIPKEGFEGWVRDHMEGMHTEYHPSFITSFPTWENRDNEYFIVSGEVVLPEPMIRVKEWKLP